jgi:regulator of protease activity HflC (stomatin/prohibitin superfamily)
MKTSTRCRCVRVSNIAQKCIESKINMHEEGRPDRAGSQDNELLRGEIGRKTADWGISVKSVESRDVAIPVALQDAMSRQAQAEREKQARVILGSAEAAIAGKFVEAALTYADHPMALQLRAMNIIYETTKERGATILIPTSMVDSLNPVVALALAGQDAASQKASAPVTELARRSPSSGRLVTTVAPVRPESVRISCRFATQ